MEGSSLALHSILLLGQTACRSLAFLPTHFHRFHQHPNLLGSSDNHPIHLLKFQSHSTEMQHNEIYMQMKLFLMMGQFLRLELWVDGKVECAAAG